MRFIFALVTTSALIALVTHLTTVSLTLAGFVCTMGLYGILATVNWSMKA